MKKKLSILLATLMVVSSLAACGQNGGDNSSGSISSSASSQEESSRDYIEGGAVSDSAPHYVSEEKLLHDRTVTPSDRVFIQEGKTDYVIILGTDDIRAANAANFLRGQLATNTGVSLKILYDVDQDLKFDDVLVNPEIEYTPDAKYIVIAHEKLEQEACIEWRTDVNLGYSGYMIQTVGDSVFMKVNSFYGYQKVAQAFLKEVVGYEWYSYDTIVHTKTATTLPDMNIVEKPDFDLIWQSGYMSASNEMASPITDEQTFAFVKPGMFCHNSLTYIPLDYYADHPDWFAHEASTPAIQLCYTAHGNKAEYDAMVQLAYEGIMDTLSNDPDAAAITFTREDVYGNCICDTCSAIQKSFNDSLAATYMFFVNDLDTKVQAELQRQADEAGTQKRDVTILFFAYREVEKAPVFGTDGEYTVPTLQYVENPDGSKTNILEYDGQIIELPFQRTYENGLECNENVGVFYAPINATYEESFYHAENKATKETFEKWGLLSNRLYCWIYDVNFTRYLMPYNSYDAIPDTLRFLKDAGGEFLFNQGARENEPYPGFGSLRTYLTYTLANEVNLDAGVLVDKFFENYFRDAAPFMREYYDTLVGYMEWLQIEYPDTFYGERRVSTDDAKYWPHETLQGWLALCDKAFAAIKKYETSDPVLYETLYKHILTETIFPRFIICESYMGYYTPSAQKQWQNDFVTDAKYLSLTNYAEGVSITPWYDKWS